MDAREKGGESSMSVWITSEECRQQNIEDDIDEGDEQEVLG